MVRLSLLHHRKEKIEAEKYLTSYMLRFVFVGSIDANITQRRFGTVKV
jgi:hypothetical protein